MTLAEAASKILNQLADMVKQIREPDYVKPSDLLGGSTIGQHVRHTIEFFLCLQGGVLDGVINYDKRAHDKAMETDKLLALETIGQVMGFVGTIRENQGLKLEVGYDLVEEEYLTVQTNTTRELVYNIEHAVHHMAIIKIGVRAIAPYVRLDEHFGIAASTLRFASSGHSLLTLKS